VVRFVILEPACQCQVVTSFVSDLACGAKSVTCFAMGDVASSTTTAVAVGIVPAAFAAGLSKYGDGSLSDLASGGLSATAGFSEGARNVSASPSIGRAPMLLLKVKRTPKEIRQISASQTVLDTLDPHVRGTKADFPKMSKVCLGNGVRCHFDDTHRRIGQRGATNQVICACTKTRSINRQSRRRFLFPLVSTIQRLALTD
jgi:hypothetical protein